MHVGVSAFGYGRVRGQHASAAPTMSLLRECARAGVDLPPADGPQAERCLMRALLALIKKDLRTFRADRRAVIVSFALPAALALLFGLLFRGESRDIRLKTRVVDLDGSPQSQALVKALLAVPEADPTGREDAVQDGADDQFPRGREPAVLHLRQQESLRDLEHWPGQSGGGDDQPE